MEQWASGRKMASSMLAQIWASFSLFRWLNCASAGFEVVSRSLVVDDRANFSAEKRIRGLGATTKRPVACPKLVVCRKYWYKRLIKPMSADTKSPFDDPAVAQQRFLSLFLRSEREIFRYVAALVPNMTDAEDIVQQTALTLWEKFDAYDPTQPFTPWACRFALNKARQWIERRQRWQALLEHGLAEELAQRRQELQPEFERRLTHLEACLGKLPPGQRSLVAAYYYERTDVESLAGRSGRTVAATYKMLQRIRQALQLCVENHAKPEVV